MKYLKIFMSFFFLVLLKNVNAELYYPVGEMSKPECRFQDFSTLGSDCKMPLPILKTSDYTKYKNDYNLYRRVYTILWGSTYNYGWDIGNGGHQGVDIASAKGTPVNAITDGKVVLASNIAGRGNTVKVEHTINGRKIYANYAHLSKIDVSVGDSVKAKDKLGEIGSTGNSFGNHLHFQIDLVTSGKGPWYRSNCSEKNYDKIINSDVCFSQLNTNTIDPLLFLETSGAVVKATTVEKPKIENISQTGLLSREEILKREIDEFLKNYNVKVQIINLGGNIELGKTGTFRITVTDKRTKRPFTGSFPGDMNFKFDGNRFNIFPTGILQIDKGIRDFTVTPKIAGKMSLDIYIGETFFKKVNFGVFDTKKSIIPKTTIFGISTNNVISETKKGVFYFKDNFGLNILGVRFDGKYTLKSDNNSMKFCIKKVSSIADLQKIYNIDCNENAFKSEITFSNSDSISGIMVFNYKILNEGVNNLSITDNSNNIISSKKLNGILPVDIKVSYPYYNDIVKISKLGFTCGINKGYFLPDRDLNREDGINFLKNYLEYKLKNCSSNDCKNIYLDKIVNLSKEYSDKYSYFTRLDYITLIGKYVPLDEYKNNDYVSFRDLKENEIVYSKNILKSSTWSDYFGQTRYFQPDKKITRGEGAFLLNKILD